MSVSKEAIEAASAGYIGDDWAILNVRTQEHVRTRIRSALEAALPFLPIAGEGRWLPIAQADRTITDVQDFSEVGITLRNSDRYWVRDTDGRVYEASWTDDKDGYWWDWEAESPVDPIEFMPHPLDPRFSALISSPGKDGGQEVDLDAYQQQRAEQGLEEDPTVYPDWSVGGGQEVEAVTRWLVKEELPSGSTRWEVFEHELHARNVAARYNHRNKTTVTPLYTRPQPASTSQAEAVTEIDWRAMYLHARGAQLKTGGSDENAAGHFADAANRAIRSALGPQPASTALVERLTSALQSARHYVVDAIDADGGIDNCDIIDRSTLEKIDAALSASQSTGREGER